MVESCTIITSEPNDFMKPIHKRMPVILATDRFEAWLSSETKPEALLESLLRPAAWSGMEAVQAP